MGCRGAPSRAPQSCCSLWYTRNNCKYHRSTWLTQPSHHPPAKMFPEAHLNFCRKVFSSVLWIYFFYFFFLANMKHVLINDIPAFMALPLVSLIYFPHLRNFFFPLPAVPRLYILCIIHPSLLSSFNTGFWEMHISLNSFFSFCFALICTFPSLQLPALLLGSLHLRRSREESSLNAPFIKPWKTSVWC